MTVARLPAADPVVDEHLQDLGAQFLGAGRALLDLGLYRYALLALLAHPGVDHGALHAALTLRRPASRDM